MDVTVCQVQGLCSAWTGRVFADGHITFRPVVTMLKFWVCTVTTYHCRRQINFESSRVVPDFVLHIRETDRPLYTGVWEVLHKTWRVTRFFLKRLHTKIIRKKTFHLPEWKMALHTYRRDRCWAEKLSVDMESTRRGSVWRKMTSRRQSKDRRLEVAIQI